MTAKVNASVSASYVGEPIVGWSTGGTHLVSNRVWAAGPAPYRFTGWIRKQAVLASVATESCQIPDDGAGRNVSAEVGTVVHEDDSQRRTTRLEPAGSVTGRQRRVTGAVSPPVKLRFASAAGSGSIRHHAAAGKRARPP